MTPKANYVVTADTERSHVRDYRGISVRFVSLAELMQRLLTPLRAVPTG